MACYYIVISSTHLRDGQLRSIKGVFRGPIGAGSQRSTEEGDSRFYCELCDKQYVRHQQYENHINSYDHHHKQRLKELKQREFYRALACRRQRRRREEKREARALRRFHQHGDKSSGQCAPGSGPMFRSTTVAVDPADQSRPDWADIRPSSAARGAKPEASLIQSFLPLDPTLETRLLSNSQWEYNPMDPSNDSSPAGAESRIPRLGYSHLTPNATNTNIKTSHYNNIPWAHGYLNHHITPNNVPTDATRASVSDSIFKKAICKSSTAIANTNISSGRPDVQSVPGRVRPVSFSLPKRTCVLLHQSAAVFIQAGQGSSLPRKQDGVSTRERAKSLREKIPHQQLKSPLSADVNVVGADHWDTGNQCGVDCKAVIQHSEAGSIMSTEKGTAGLSGLRAQVSLCNRNAIGVEDSIIRENGAQLSLCNDNGTEAQVSQESETRAHFYLNSGLPGHISDGVSRAVAQDTVSEDSELEIHDVGDNRANEEVTNEPCLAADEPKITVSESPAQTYSKESNPSPSVWAKQSASAHPARPKEPFCPVLSRDGSRVLLWPTEMVSYTKTSPSISYSINPLLYDFRAHNKAKEGGEERKGGLEEGRQRIKPSVIKQPDCQQRQGDTEGGREVKVDEREEGDEGGQAGNPMELVAHCSGSGAVLDRAGCHDESGLKFVPDSAECHPAPTPGLQKTLRKRRRRRRRRAGVRKGMRKRGRRKRREETDRKVSERGRRIIGALCVNQMFEGRAEERLNREGTLKEERREKGLLSNLAAHRLAGGREKRMRGEEKRIRGDQTERERAGRNDEKRGELLSNLPVNRCNRCNQLCLQVKRKASQHQSQQSASGWGRGLRKLLCGGAACNSVISPVPGSVIEMPCCPAITPGPARNGRETGAIHQNTQAGKEDEPGDDDEKRRNPRTAEIRAIQDAKENMWNPAISGGTARQPEMCLVPKPQREAACDPAISLVPAPFRETACCGRQTIPAGHDNPVSGTTSRCSAQQSQSKARISSACADAALPADVLSTDRMLKGSAAATKRKSGPPEDGAAPRKKRKRGRRQARRVGAVSQEVASPGSASDPCVRDTCCFQELKEDRPNETLEDETTDCRTGHTPCHTADHSEGAFSCVATDGDRDDGEPSTNDCSTEKEKPLSATAAGDHGRQEAGDDGHTHNPPCNAAIIRSDPRCDRAPELQKTLDTPVDVLPVECSTCSTNERHSDHCRCKNKAVAAGCQAADAFQHDCEQINKSDHRSSEGENTKQQRHIGLKNNASDSAIDRQSCGGVYQSDRRGRGVDSGQCDYLNRNCATDCDHCVDNGGGVKSVAVATSDAAKQTERRLDWGTEWVRRKEKEHLYLEKRARFPHRLPPACIPLHAPLLLPPSLSSSSSSSFSIHHTIIRHRLSLLPPPSHLPVPSYPHLLPSFSPHLSPLPAPPPPPPPFYTTSPISLLEAPGPFPLTFHPVQSHHTSLFTPPHPAILPLQVLF